MIKKLFSKTYEYLLLKLYSKPYFNKKTHDKYWGKLLDFLVNNEFENIHLAWENIFNQEFQNPKNISFIRDGKVFQKSFKDYLEIQKKYLLDQFEPIIEKNQIDLILDLGSGWSRNSITIANEYKNIKVLSGEFSNGGRKVANFLIKKYRINNIKTFQFDWNNPKSLFDNISRINPKAIIIFSNCSIEQIPNLKISFFEKLIKSGIMFYSIHNEPVAWQLNNIKKPFKENYNLNFIEILKRLENENKISNLSFEIQKFGHKDTLVGRNCVTINYKRK